MTIEEAVRACHADWFGKKCKVKNYRTFNVPADTIFTITRVNVNVGFDSKGEVYTVYLNDVFFRADEQSHERFTSRPDLDIEIL